jgi:hypothetical protein
MNKPLDSPTIMRQGSLVDETGASDPEAGAVGAHLLSHPQPAASSSGSGRRAET